MSNEKTAPAHWDAAYARAPRMRIASPVNIGSLNLQRLLRRYVRPGDEFLEIGCAPGKMLAWVAKELDARVTGLDYSRPGIALTQRLLEHCGVAADTRCENIFRTTLLPESFDVVYSGGVIEHFDDPTGIVAQHVSLVRRGGVAVIAIPNYGGLYGRAQRRLDPGNLSIHNLDIMSVPALERLGKIPGCVSRAFPFGRFSPWLLSLDKRMPGGLALAAGWAGNFIGQLQPVTVPALAPLLVLEVRKR